MRRSLIFLLLFAPLIECLSSPSAITAGSETPETSETSLSNPYSWGSNLFNSLWPKLGNDVALLVTLDGTIYMVNTTTGEIQWDVPSGAPIYTSYQDVNYFNKITSDDYFFIDVGEDGALYSHTSKGKEKLSSTIEEYIGRTPIWSKDGGVTLGSRRTTVFQVVAQTGKPIHVYNSADTPSKTDYEITHHSSGKVVWNVTFAAFDSYPQVSNTGNELALKHSRDSDSILPYQMKTIILLTRDPRLTESLSVLARRTDKHPGGSLAIKHGFHDNLPATVQQIPLPPRSDEGRGILATYRGTEDPGILGTHGRGVGQMNATSRMAEAVTKLQSLFLFLLALLSIMVYVLRRYVTFGKQRKLKEVVEETKVQTGVPKKKKTRRLGNNKRNVIDEKNTSNVLHEYEVGESKESIHSQRSKNKFLLTFTDHVDGQIEGRRIGKLLVFNNEIAKGSNGTIVLEGTYDGRPVAVKRLVRAHHDVALKEVQNLIASDQHPNIVRWYGVEYDQDFVYLSLERCICSLNDLIYFYSESIQSQITKDQEPHFLTEYTVQLHTIMENNKGIELWKANGCPSPQLLKLMSDLVSGLAHLHELGIIHRDLKPQNVLIIKGRSLRAKLSDMGISKRLQGDRSSITQHATGYGSSGWQAPEQLRHQRQTRAVDLFSLGCLLFFCVTGGKHPYGDSIERDVNIVNDQKDLFLVDTIPEAVDLFTRLLDPNPDMRPTAMDVLHHPFFWSSETRLSFLRDASDRVELEDRENESELLNALEGAAAVALNGKWDEKMESAFINNIGRYRRYKFDSVRDLLRVIRNKLNHYRELPQDIQEILGPVPEGFNSYFSSRFPKLLIEVYKVLYSYIAALKHKFELTSITMATTTLPLLLLVIVSSFQNTVVSGVGINYGTLGNNLPPPKRVAQLLQATLIDKVKIYDTNPEILQAFSNTGIDLIVAVENSHVSNISTDVAAADEWFATRVLPFIPATSITAIAVGNEYLTTTTAATKSDKDPQVDPTALVQAMQNLHAVLIARGLERKIKVTTPHSMAVLASSFPPSSSTFATNLVPTMTSIAAFLADTGAPFMVNAYPYFAYWDNPDMVNLQYALLGNSTSNGVRDPKGNDGDGNGGGFGFGEKVSGVIRGPSVWCVAKPHADEKVLQAVLDFCCGGGGVDCREIYENAYGRCRYPQQ
ncbi:hypothetical protein ACE6H2_016042 [Prunus campanulata]